MTISTVTNEQLRERIEIYAREQVKGETPEKREIAAFYAAEFSELLAVREAQPYGYLRENDGQVQISIGPERPPNRSGGYATPWGAIYAAPPAPAVLGRPRLSPRMYADCVNMLQEIAIAFHGTGQLRAQLNSVLGQYVEPDHPHTRATIQENTPKTALGTAPAVNIGNMQNTPAGLKLVPVELLSTASMLIDLCRTYATLNGGGTYNQRVLSDCETTMNAIAILVAAAPTPTK